ncbi:GIY-YIG nuclease family protein [Rhodospirillaceae bacterium KN72]|uniref:GIY-YIG nuclease family protein n=1 Tax=Pacificispira spongiicola TaxID=2729598 RepID=A0A7Y0E3J9_9PROT|nr:GIY-YIG nuclease family protein [Pacificispira spongiicola]NMM46571.1 GIY-YIG nuclease family protein [Pacificispira spongiicola]
MATMEDVQNIANEYAVRYGNMNMHWSDPWDIQCNFDQTWPNNGRPGCYAIFDHDLELIYIGKTNNLGKRLGDYFKVDPTDPTRKRGVPKIPEAWGAEPNFVLTVALDNAYEAPSLEEYLIEKFQPLGNTIGIKT